MKSFGSTTLFTKTIVVFFILKIGVINFLNIYEKKYDQAGAELKSSNPAMGEFIFAPITFWEMPPKNFIL
jgi:hypothetical protein